MVDNTESEYIDSRLTGLQDISSNPISINSYDDTPPLNATSDINQRSAASETPNHTIVIGAGVAGLLSAWSLAQRGLQVTIVDKDAPLAGASGNPRALLAPNMTPIHHVYEHLHTIGYLYSCRLYHYFNERATLNNNGAAIFEPSGALDLLVKTNIGTEQIADYPNSMATTITPEAASAITHLTNIDLSVNLYLPQAGLVNPQALKTIILAHPNISYQQLTVMHIKEHKTHVVVYGKSTSEDDCHNNDAKASDSNCDSNYNKYAISITADNTVICAAYDSHTLDNRIVACRKIRGQLSWFTPTAEQCARLPKIPLKYSGYCAPFIGQQDDGQLNNIIENQPQFLVGASFVDGDTDIDIRCEENQQNHDKLLEDIPELANVLTTDTGEWQARAGIRTQTIDYHPLVGLLKESERLWTLSAMGAKGYAIAPICAESLADMMLGCFTPLPAALLKRLSPNRSSLHKPLV